MRDYAPSSRQQLVRGMADARTSRECAARHLLVLRFGSLHESFDTFALQMVELLCAHVENVALYPHERF